MRLASHAILAEPAPDARLAVTRYSDKTHSFLARKGLVCGRRPSLDLLLQLLPV